MTHGPAESLKSSAVVVQLGHDQSPVSGMKSMIIHHPKLLEKWGIAEMNSHLTGDFLG